MRELTFEELEGVSGGVPLVVFGFSMFGAGFSAGYMWSRDFW